MESRRNFLKSIAAIGLESTLSGCVNYAHPEEKERIDPAAVELLRRYQTDYKNHLVENHAKGIQYLQPYEFVLPREILEAMVILHRTNHPEQVMGFYKKKSPNKSKKDKFEEKLDQLNLELNERIALQALFGFPQNILYKEEVFFRGIHPFVIRHERTHRYMHLFVSDAEHEILKQTYHKMEKDKTQLQSRIPDLNQLDGLIVHEGIILDNELISYKFKYAFTNYEEFYASLVEGLLLGIETTLKEYDPKAYSIFTKIREASQL